MKDKSANLPEDLGTRALFACMNEEYVGNVVSRVLRSLGRASPESKRAFETEMDKLNLRIPGFRTVSLAPPHMLRDPVRHSLMGSDKLASAALEVWVESHQPLREIVQERIDDIGAYIGVSAEPADLSKNGLKGNWPQRSWDRERERFATLHDDYDEDDLALMMCYVSGRLPGMEDSDGESEAASDAVEQLPDILNLLAQCAVDLENLPVSAPEWESDIPEFAEKIAKTVSSKREERNRAATLDSFIAEIRDEFSPELAYLESDIASWSANRLPSGGDIARALGTCEELRSALVGFRTVRESPPAATRSEEAERRKKNDELGDLALGLVERIERLVSGDPMPDDDPPRKADHARERSELDSDNHPQPSPTSRDEAAPVSRFPDFDLDHLSHENISLKSEIDDLRRENESLRTENSRVEDENEALRSENQKLEGENQSLRLDKEDLRREMRAELSKSRDEVTRLRLAYDEERNMPRPTLEDVSLHIESVDDAVRYASEMFPDRLLFRTNSKSVVRENSFEKPKDVWSALEWLATTYHSAKMGELSERPDFDLSIREACGWWYKSDQHETTRNKYRDWYTTRVNGDRRWLLEHIGTGASKDARHTIRIAFDWDKDEKLVVVGYIGQHQRTDAT
jgi:FtsZ-binding cell division protein ZapB